ncbi:MAG: type II toxin-antitoxin system ParD family antitoxin [Sphingomonadaceae bacterium]
MAQMNISLPEGLKAWTESRVAEGDYSSTSDYIRDLVRRDREAARELAWLQTEIDGGLASGVHPGTPLEIVEGIIVESRARRAA